MIKEYEIYDTPEKNYELYKSILREKIKRPGLDRFLNWLDSSDAMYAPASTQYHLSCQGGLIVHSINVYNRLVSLVKEEGKKQREEFKDDFDNFDCFDYENLYSEDTIALVSLLHDISKINYYKVSMRNTKDEQGKWIQVPYYSVRDENDRFIFGSHSEDSLYMVSKFFDLSYEEELAILYHMGGLDSTEDKITMKNISPAFKKSRLAVLLHAADLQATFIDEVTHE